jgi:hypothetical protein
MIHTATSRLRTLIESVLTRHHDISTAVEELVNALEDEFEVRVQDRVADLCDRNGRLTC